MSDLVRPAKLWAQKWRWYQRNSLPWNRARIHCHMLRRECFARWPLHGDVLEALDEGRLEIGANALLEPHVWITAPAPARVRIGEGTFLNVGVMVAAIELVEIGSLHARQRLHGYRRRPPLRRSRQAGPLAGLHDQGPDADR